MEGNEHFARAAKAPQHSQATTVTVCISKGLAARAWRPHAGDCYWLHETELCRKAVTMHIAARVGHARLFALGLWKILEPWLH
jgi:hypothetical protein